MVRSRHDFSRGGTLRSPPPGTYNHLLRLGLVDRTAYDVSVRALNDEGRAYSLDLVVWTGNPPTVVPPDWGLIPDGLEAGDRFRLLFATSTTGQANHGDIAHYNTFVQNTAAAGHADIQAYSELFAVVGSTADTLSWPGATDARDNTATNYIDVDKGPPIYWLNGSKVADNYEDFHDGTWDDEDGAKDESGNDRSLSQASERPYTGSNNDGTGLALNALGASGFQVGLGHPGDDGNAGPLAGGGTSDGNSARPVYALSPVFEVGPEEFEFEVGANWGLAPSGLTAGDKFRLLFIAEHLDDLAERNVLEVIEPRYQGHSVATFNKLVQDQAAAGHAAIQADSERFAVVGNVSPAEYGWFPRRREEILLPGTLEEILDAGVTHARDNTRTNHTSDSDKGVPIYWMNGSKVGARRTARPRDLLHVDGSKDLDRTVASAVQHSSVAQRVGLSATGPGRHQPSSLIRTGSTLGGGSLKHHSRDPRYIQSR